HFTRLALEPRAEEGDARPLHDRLAPAPVHPLGLLEQRICARIEPRRPESVAAGDAPRVLLRVVGLLRQGPRPGVLGPRPLLSEAHLFAQPFPKELRHLHGQRIPNLEHVALWLLEARPPEVGAARAVDEAHRNAVARP